MPTTSPPPLAGVICAQLRIQGKVQGVFFRESARREAQQRALTGWVRNLPTGEVEARVEGPREEVESFIAWCRRGPPAAKVETVSTSFCAAMGELTHFVVER